MGVAACGARPLAPTHAGQARLAHHPSHPLAAHRRALLGQLGLNARRTVAPPAMRVNRPHAGSEGFVAALSCRTPSLTPRIEPARGDTEHPGHRGDAQLGLMRSHEPVDLPGPTSRANQAAAFASIARSSRRRRFSRRSRRISSRSALLNPSARRPSSRSACATQLRIAWAVGSNSRANSSGVRPVRTNSTIWRRKAGGYGGLDFGMVDTSSPKGQVSTKSDQLHLHRNRPPRHPSDFPPPPLDRLGIYLLRIQKLFLSTRHPHPILHRPLLHPQHRTYTQLIRRPNHRLRKSDPRATGIGAP